ncbi:MAG: hypothetical protein CL494_07415 [Actinobacteria bacterium]|nr:hypothetical protein [Actinomycetota bacterium]|tara:strand:+ start:2637 stop:3575 length:939 start_codon:yes stop_codon:yes gene_type:complete
MIFVGPTLASGIGQHCHKYLPLFPDATYYQFGQEIPETDHAFIFVIPVQSTLVHIPGIKAKAKKVTCMTVCETDPVHADYGLICEHFDRIAVPSEFCRDVLSRQFPQTEFYVIHAHIPQRPYTFYHIGNVADDRKQFNSILEAFVRLNKPDARLLVKATCNRPVEIKLPNVEVINGLVSDRDMDIIHGLGDCYVAFSKSEGVGMGAVEAAVRDKPVITTAFGGSSEYIHTPYMIECERQELVKDDFLFKAGTTWGKPNFDQLLAFMADAYEKRLQYMDHAHTKRLVGRPNVLREFLVDVECRDDDDPYQNCP